eukprot:gene4945-5186_t
MDRDKLRLVRTAKGGAELTVYFGSPISGESDYCGSQLRGSWAMLNEDYCGPCFNNLGKLTAKKKPLWWFSPAEERPRGTMLSCDGCSRSSSSTAAVGMYKPFNSRCSDCQQKQLGVEYDWHLYQAPSARSTLRAKGNSSAAAESALLKAGTAILAAGSAALTGLQLAHLHTQFTADGVLTAEEGVRMGVEATAGQLDNLFEVAKAVLESDPAPFATEVINNAEDPGIMDHLANAFLGLFSG